MPTFSVSLPFLCSYWIDITTDRLTDLARKETDSYNLYNVYLIWVVRVIFFFCRLSCTGFKTFLSDKLLQSQSKSSNTNEAHVTFFASNPDDRQYCLIGETFGKGILDSGCTKTVSGEIWMNEYIDMLSIEDKESIEESESDSMYRFGDGKESNALKNLKISIVIGNKLSVDVVKNDIPLLISRKSMINMKMKLYFNNDSANVYGDKISLHCSSTGHYCIPFTSWDLDIKDTNIILHSKHFHKIDEADKEKRANKLNRQNAHAS